MMTSTFKVVIPDRFKLATRPNGVEARTYVLMVLKAHAAVELDFQGRPRLHLSRTSALVFSAGRWVGMSSRSEFA